MKNILEFFKSRKVLITGHTGFKGSWLALWLHDLGALVQGYALPAKSSEDHFSLLSLEKHIQHKEGDVRDYESLSSAFKKFEPEIVFHLAAQSLVHRSYEDPKTTFDTNLGGATNLLESVRHTPSVKAVVFITSDKCYLNKEWVWGYRESDELGGKDAYSASKAAAELIARSYRECFFQKRRDLGFATVRAGNVVGGGDWSGDRIVPDCIRALRGNRPIVLRNPRSTRPWQHVLEPLSGYMAVAYELSQDPAKFSSAWNFGPSTDRFYTVQHLAEAILKNWGEGRIVVDAPKDAPYEAGLLHLNCDKSHHLLNWRPRWDFEMLAQQTAHWYKRVLSGEQAIQVSREQIAEYVRSTCGIMIDGILITPLQQIPDEHYAHA